MLSQAYRIRIFLLLALMGVTLALDAPLQAQPSSSSPAGDITLTGKLACSVKRAAWLAFPGEIREICVQPGQKVEAGDVLLRYRLHPEVVAQLSRRLSPPQLRDLNVRLAETDKNIANLEDKLRGLKELARHDLTSKQSLLQVEREIKTATSYRGALAQTLKQEQRFIQEERAVLEKQLGQPLSSPTPPREAQVLAPMSGYVLWIHPDLRVGGEMRANDPAIQIGVMDPMIIRTRVYETETQQLKVGEAAEVVVESLPGRQFTAQVAQIPWSTALLALEQPSYYEVEFKVPNPDLILKEGLKAKVTVKKPK